jgi:TPR repeat protein
MNAGEPDNSLFDYRTPWTPTLFARFENFGDANAQYNLARMHFEGAGVKKDSRWLCTSKRRLCSVRRFSRAAKVFGRSARSASCG